MQSETNETPKESHDTSEQYDYDQPAIEAYETNNMSEHLDCVHNNAGSDNKSLENNYTIILS